MYILISALNDHWSSSDKLTILENAPWKVPPASKFSAPQGREDRVSLAKRNPLTLLWLKTGGKKGGAARIGSYLVLSTEFLPTNLGVTTFGVPTWRLQKKTVKATGWPRMTHLPVVRLHHWCDEVIVSNLPCWNWWPILGCPSVVCHLCHLCRACQLHLDHLDFSVQNSCTVGF